MYVGQEALDTSFARSSLFKSKLKARYSACAALKGEARCRRVGLACCTKDMNTARVPDKAKGAWHMRYLCMGPAKGMRAIGGHLYSLA